MTHSQLTNCHIIEIKISIVIEIGVQVNYFFTDYSIFFKIDNEVNYGLCYWMLFVINTFFYSILSV